MRPCVTPPLTIRGIEFGGPKPLFCVPLVAKTAEELLDQAHIARQLEADVIEWRVDSFSNLDDTSVLDAIRRLRMVLDHEPILFTLRSAAEGGVKQLPQHFRTQCISAAVRSRLIDLVDIELSNEPEMVETVVGTAHAHATRVVLSFHDFHSTPPNSTLLLKISEMAKHGADVAKIACMPQNAADVLRLLESTFSARQAYPALPLCTMAMGRAGALSRVAGFLYGSDMAFAVGQQISAPGQIPIREARAMTEALLRYACE